jgi:hypothetical protein
MQGSGGKQVVDEAPFAGHKALGFFSSNSFSNRRIDRKFHNDASDPVQLRV